MRDSANASENDDSDEGDDDGDDDADSTTSGSPSKRIKLDTDVPPLPAELSIPEIPPPTVIPAVEHLTRPGLQLDERTKSDSPLKQVSIVSSAPTSPIKENVDETTAEETAPVTQPTPESVPLQVETVEEAQAAQVAVTDTEDTPIMPAVEAIHQIDVEMQKEVPQLVPESIPELPPAPTEEAVESIVQLRKEEEEEEAMLLNLQEKAGELLEHSVEAATEDLAAPIPEKLNTPPAVASPDKEQPPTVPETIEDVGENSDTDLLGDLEKSLGN